MVKFEDTDIFQPLGISKRTESNPAPSWTNWVPPAFCLGRLYLYFTAPRFAAKEEQDRPESTSAFAFKRLSYS